MVVLVEEVYFLDYLLFINLLICWDSKMEGVVVMAVAEVAVVEADSMEVVDVADLMEDVEVEVAVAVVVEEGEGEVEGLVEKIGTWAKSVPSSPFVVVVLPAWATEML